MKWLLCLLFIVSLPCNSFAYTVGPTNFGGIGYPDKSCYKPSLPYSDDSWAWDMFRADAERYERCIKDYIEAAKYDQQRVIEKANEAVDEYNRFIRSARNGY